MTNVTSSVVCDYLLNSLNEVLHGFPVDFQATLGYGREHVQEVFSTLDARCKPAGRLISECVDRSQVILLLACSRLCREELDADEFETRLGISLERALEVEAEISTLLG
jgi:hypothetical protein